MPNNTYLLELGVESKDFWAKVKTALEEIAQRPVVCVMRGIERVSSLDKIEQFLRDDCQLTLDSRHYDIETADMNIEVWGEISYQPAKDQYFAHSKTLQPFHTDTAWFDDAADINFFCMKKQVASGGCQMFYPLDRLLDDLANEAPNLLNDLVSTPVLIKKGDLEFQNHTTIIRQGEQPTIHWNFYRIDKTDSDIQAMCQALFDFLANKQNSKSVWRLRAETGDCFAFTDHLMLHGRDAFDATKPKDRILLNSMWNRQPQNQKGPEP